MIDLHCHMLPGIDDGAPDLDTALAMARLAVADGVRIVACTPHIYVGLYDNNGPGIKQAVNALRVQLSEAAIPLQITYGADVHLAPDLTEGLRNRRIPSLHGSRYFLLEPPHHVAPPRFEESVFNLLAADYVPVITHPERLTWIGDHYPLFLNLARSGAWMQITAGSLTGRFGSQAQYWGRRMLKEGYVHILASDGHGVKKRPPLLAEGRIVAAHLLGDEEAEYLVNTRPQAILDNLPPVQVSPPPGLVANPSRPRRLSLFRRLFRRR